MWIINLTPVNCFNEILTRKQYLYLERCYTNMRTSPISGTQQRVDTLRTKEYAGKYEKSYTYLFRLLLLSLSLEVPIAIICSPC